MARPQSKGISYFPMNVDFLGDIKIRKIIRACGAGSIAVLLCLLGNIYRDEGYYMWWDEDVAFLIADSLGVSEGLVSETVKKAIQVDFFNQKMLQKYSILTSKGIQSRFFEATKKRSNSQLMSDYIIVSAPETPVSAPETPVSAPESTQSKVKKSKDDDLDILPKLVIGELNDLLKIKVKESSSIVNLINLYPEELWLRCLEEIKLSDYLKGNLKIFWLEKVDNFNKVLSGFYRNHQPEAIKKQWLPFVQEVE